MQLFSHTHDGDDEYGAATDTHERSVERGSRSRRRRSSRSQRLHIALSTDIHTLTHMLTDTYAHTFTQTHTRIAEAYKIKDNDERATKKQERNRN